MTEEYKEIPKIYPNKNVKTSLSNCIAIETEMDDGIFMIYCKMAQNELNYFSQNNLPLAYDILCGSKEETASIVHILDKTRYPVFRVKGLVMPDYHSLEFSTNFSLTDSLFSIFLIPFSNSYSIIFINSSIINNSFK